MNLDSARKRAAGIEFLEPTPEGGIYDTVEAARWRESDGDRIRAEELAREAAAAGITEGWTDLAVMRTWAGDWAAAQDAYQRAIAAADSRALEALAGLRERLGDRDGADRIRRFGITADGLPETRP